MTKRGRSRARRTTPEYQSYLLELGDWHVSYGFSLGHENLGHGPYWEHCELLVDGSMTYPPKFKGEKLNMTLLGDRREDAILDETNNRSFSPRAVGSLNMRGKSREYLGSIPLTALWGLLPALEAGKLRWISLYGEPVKWGKALITSIGFSRDYVPVDFE